MKHIEKPYIAPSPIADDVNINELFDAVWTICEALNANADEGDKLGERVAALESDALSQYETDPQIVERKIPEEALVAFRKKYAEKGRALRERLRGRQELDPLADENQGEELKPCPFCNKPFVVERGASWDTVRCTTCGYHITRGHVGPVESVESVINTRPIEDELRTKNARLNKRVSEYKSAVNRLIVHNQEYKTGLVEANAKIERYEKMAQRLQAWRAERGEGDYAKDRIGAILAVLDEVKE